MFRNRYQATYRPEGTGAYPGEYLGEPMDVDV